VGYLGNGRADARRRLTVALNEHRIGAGRMLMLHGAPRRPASNRHLGRTDPTEVTVLGLFHCKDPVAAGVAGSYPAADRQTSQRLIRGPPLLRHGYPRESSDPSESLAK
jgi:hypothetical protein